MRRIFWIGVAGALLLLLNGCSSVSYVTDWDTQNDFSQYRTFAWYELAATPDRGTQPAAPNAIVADRIRRSVQSALASKGLTPEAAGEADLLVTYHIACARACGSTTRDGDTPTAAAGAGVDTVGAAVTARHDSLPKGTLIVDVLDGKKRRLVWRGIAEGAFKKSNPSDDQVAKIVNRVLTDFPPA